MGNTPRPPEIKLLNFSVVVIAAQAGCAAVLVILVALVGGLWLDSQAGQRGIFTVILIILSVPVSLTLMLRIALVTARRLSRPREPRPDLLTEED